MFNSRSDSLKGGCLTGEVICLVAPLIIFPFMAWEFQMANAVPYYLAFLVANAGDGLLGSVGHSGLAWGLVYLTPEGREWWSTPESRILRMKIVGVALGSFATMLALFFMDDGRLLTWFLAAYISLTFHHSLMQTQGLAFAYSFENEPDPEERIRIQRLHNKQKYAFGYLVFLSCVYPVADLLNWHLFEPLSHKVAYFLSGVAVAGWLIFSNLSLRSPQKHKMIFLARTFCVPLGVFSVFAAQGTRVFHSLEYILIYRKMLSNSESRKLFGGVQRAVISIFLYLAASSIWIYFFVTADELRADYEFASGMPAALKVLAALTLTRSLMHFYMDRQIFKMSNPVSRRLFAPLLNKEAAVVQS